MFTKQKKVNASHLSSALPSRSSWFISFQKHQFQLEPSAGAVGDAPSPFVQCSLLRSKSFRGGERIDRFWRPSDDQTWQSKMDHLYPFISDFTNKSFIPRGFSIAMFDYQRVNVWYSLGSWLSHPLKNMRSSVGKMTFPIYGKIEFMFQTTNQISIADSIYILMNNQQ